MPNILTVSYNNNIIKQTNEATVFDLDTAGKLCVDDINVDFDLTKYNGVITDGDGTNPVLPSGSTLLPVAPENDVNFIDYDGTIRYSYSAEDFADLTALPPNPSHEGLTAQGWNWFLSDAQTYVESYGKLDVCQMYITDDGKTRIYIKLEDGRLAPYLGIAINGSADVDWGDGSAHNTVTGSDLTTVVDTQHTYAAAGKYVIVIDVTGEAALLGDSSKGSSVVYKGSSATADENKVYQNLISHVELGNDIDIGVNAFMNCYSLVSITVPSGVAGIGQSAFVNCYSLASITIPSSVISIGANSFVNCYSLVSVPIPSSVASIGESAFSSCSALKSVNITGSVTSIGAYVFRNCYSLVSITIPSGVTSIGESAFSNCYSLASIMIPSGVTSIGSSAFISCYSLASITIPSSVTSIGVTAFMNCYSLVSIMIPISVTSIGASIFTNCYSLVSITIPSSVASIGATAFGGYYGSGGCKGLGYIIFEPITPPTVVNANAFLLSSDCSMIVPFSALAAYLSATNYPAPATYTYVGFATYAVDAALPTKDSTQAYNVTWYATKVDALAQTNAITAGNGNEIYCRYTAA